MVRHGELEWRGLGTGSCTGLRDSWRSLLSLHGGSHCVMKEGLRPGSILPSEGHLQVFVIIADAYTVMSDGERQRVLSDVLMS